MLVLSRKSGEAVSIGHDIRVKVIEIRGSRVKLGFDCPSDVRILREEVVDELPARRVEVTRQFAELVAN